MLIIHAGLGISVGYVRTDPESGFGQKKSAFHYTQDAHTPYGQKSADT